MKLPLKIEPLETDPFFDHMLVDADGEFLACISKLDAIESLVALANAHADSSLPCPDCEGTGKTKWVLCHASTPDDRPLSAIEAAALATDISQCQFCEATGKVDQVKLLWRRIGQEWKETRKLLAVGMREWATSIGVPASEYLAMEAGRIEPKEECSPLPKLRERLANAADSDYIDRAHGRILELEEALKAANAAQPGAPGEDGSWIIQTKNGDEYITKERMNICGLWCWVIGDDEDYIPEESIVAHRKHTPLEVPNG